MKKMPTISVDDIIEEEDFIKTDDYAFSNQDD